MASPSGGATSKRKEQTKRRDLTQIEIGVRSFLDIRDLRVYHAKQADDDLVRRHAGLLLMGAIHPYRRKRLCFAQMDVPA